MEMDPNQDLNSHSIQSCTGYKDSFYLCKRSSDLLIQGWTIVTDNQFILVTLCLFFTTVFLEAGRRKTRELNRKILEIDKQLHAKSKSSVSAVSFIPLVPTNEDQLQVTTNDSNGATQNILEETVYETLNNLQPKNENWKTNQDGSMQLNNNDSLSSDKVVDMVEATESAGSQTVPLKVPLKVLKRHLSFDLSINRFEGSVERINRVPKEDHEHDEVKFVSVSIRRRLLCRRMVIHILTCVLHVCELILGYLLMLIIMSYNGWYLSVIVIGASAGYALFSWDRIRLKSLSSTYSKVSGVETSV